MRFYRWAKRKAVKSFDDITAAGVGVVIPCILDATAVVFYFDLFDKNESGLETRRRRDTTMVGGVAPFKQGGDMKYIHFVLFRTPYVVGSLCM